MKGLHIPVYGYPQILFDDTPKSKLHVFGNEDVLISKLNDKSSYYHYPQNYNNIHPVNFIATHLKRLHSNNYKLVVRGDIIVYSSYEGIPNTIDDDVSIDIIQQVLLCMDQLNGFSRY